MNIRKFITKLYTALNYLFLGRSIVFYLSEYECTIYAVTSTTSFRIVGSNDRVSVIRDGALIYTRDKATNQYVIAIEIYNKIIYWLREGGDIL